MPTSHLSYNETLSFFSAQYTHKDKIYKLTVLANNLLTYEIHK